MATRLIIVITFSFMYYTSYSQINLSFDKNCIEKNSVVLSNALIESAGIVKISKILDSNISLMTFWEVDSLGSVLKLIKIVCKDEFPIDFKDQLTDYLINNNVRFLICFEKPPGLNKCEAYKTISQSIFDENKRSVVINVPFPGDLMLSFNIEKEKAMQQGHHLTRIKYLQNIINEYSQR